MAKGQQRSNREAKKPKKDKALTVSESPFKAQNKAESTAGSVARAKGKGAKS